MILYRLAGYNDLWNNPPEAKKEKSDNNSTLVIFKFLLIGISFKMNARHDNDCAAK